MKPRRPYFSSADKARPWPGNFLLVGGDFWRSFGCQILTNMPGKIYCIPINLGSMTKMMFNIVSE